MRKLVLLAGLGAAIGSSLRYSISLSLPVTPGTSFPWPTLIVNLLGSFLIGLIATNTNLVNDEAKRAFYVAGVLGGFTTFSALAVEAVDMVGRPALFTTYLVSTIAGGVLLAQLGVILKIKITK